MLVQPTISMEQARRLDVQAEDVHKGEMSTLAKVGAKHLESNVDMVLVSVDRLSNTVIVPASDQKRQGGFVPMVFLQYIAQ